jgi:oxygen-dependent protoporphyrinogen oxidase
LLRGLRKTSVAASATGSAGANGAPAAVFMGPRGGMQRIVDELVNVLSGVADLRTDAVVSALEPCRRQPRGSVDGVPLPVDGVRVTLAGESESYEFDGVIVATSAGVTAGLVQPHAPRAAETLRALKYASVAQTALAYDPADLPPLPDATGFLVPRPEGTVMTACTLLDQKWPERRAALGDDERSEPIVSGSAGAGFAEDGVDGEDLRHAVVIKCSAGRIDDHRIDDLDDHDLVATLHHELSEIIGPIKASPIARRVFRATGGLPQYEPGHLDRIDAVVADVAAAAPAVSLTGAAYRGTSVPICIREGRAAADAQLARLLPPA